MNAGSSNIIAFGKKNKRTIYLFSLLTLLFLGSCKKDNPIETKQIITFTSDPYELALGIETQIEPKGGDGKYVIVQIGDTSIADGYASGKNVFLTAKRYGNTTLKVTDSSRSTIGSVNLVVKDLVIRTNKIVVPVRMSGEIVIESKRRNFLVTVSDTTIAKPGGFYEYETNNHYYVKTHDFGSTSIIVLDSNTMISKTISLQVIQWPDGFVKYSSDTLNFNVINSRSNNEICFADYKIYRDKTVLDYLRIYANKIYSDDVEDLFIIAIDTDSLYQGVHVSVSDSGNQRFLILYNQALSEDVYQSVTGSFELTKLSDSTISGKFSGTCFSIEDYGEDTRIDSTKRLDIKEGEFEMDFNIEKFISSMNSLSKKSGSNQNRSLNKRSLLNQFQKNRLFHQ